MSERKGNMPWPKGLPRLNGSETADQARARLAKEKAWEERRPNKPPPAPPSSREQRADRMVTLVGELIAMGQEGAGYIDAEIVRTEELLAFLRRCRDLFVLPPAPAPEANGATMGDTAEKR